MGRRVSNLMFDRVAVVPLMLAVKVYVPAAQSPHAPRSAHMKTMDSLRPARALGVSVTTKLPLRSTRTVCVASLTLTGSLR